METVVKKNYHRNTQKYKKTLVKILITIIVAIVGFTMIIPFLWMLSASFKISAEVMELPIRWIPKHFTPNNYKAVWNIGKSAARDYHFGLSYFNSLKIAFINLFGAVLTSTMAGYAFAKINFKGRNILFLGYLATMMIPQQVTLIPKFVMFSKLNLIGTHLTLILPGIITVTGTFLMRQYFMQIPEELKESAYIDGANEFQIWARIMVPVAKPSMASLAMIVFLWNWNNYQEALVFLADWRLYTIPVSLTNFIEETSTQYNLIMAASASALIPVFVVFLAGQKFFVKGLMAGAVKG
jgi:multiple sugar transport system permease protein